MSLPVISSEDKLSFPIGCSMKMTFSSDNKESKIQEVASFISQVYAKFLRLNQKEKEILRNRGFLFRLNSNPQNEPDSEKFETVLKNQIIQELSNSQIARPSIKLFANSPSGLLYQAAKAADIESYALWSKIPDKSLTYVYIENKEKTLQLEMNFKAGLPLLR